MLSGAPARPMQLQEFEEWGLGYQLCDGCWPAWGEAMTNYTPCPYVIDGRGMIWIGWPDEPGKRRAEVALQRLTTGSPLVDGIA